MYQKLIDRLRLRADSVEKSQGAMTPLAQDLCEAAKVIEALLDVFKAKRDGRLVDLPCKVGDTVFGIQRHHKRGSYVLEGVVREMYFAEEDMRLCIVIKGSCRGEWGKVIFGTREDAERALEGGKNNADT